MEFPRLRWLLILQLVTMAGASLDAGSVIDALGNAGVMAGGVVSLVLFTLRLGAAFLEIDTDDEFIHTMTTGRRVKQAGLWELVW